MSTWLSYGLGIIWNHVNQSIIDSAISHLCMQLYCVKEKSEYIKHSYISIHQ